MTNSQTQNNFHTPVLLEEAVDALNVQIGQWYVDCTLGGGGHTKEIVRRGGKVLGIDQDKDSLAEARENLKEAGEVRFQKANFSALEAIVREENITPAGVLFDLGVSSHQLSGQGRGFSLQVDEPLDMRMDPETQTVTARNLVNGLYEKELEKLITTYGEDPLAKRIAAAIIRTRSSKPIETTRELADLVAEVYKKTYRKPSRIHPATRTFQALRIAVNDEINVLKEALVASLKVLKPRGRCVVISFHGLEDKVVKTSFRVWETKTLGKTLTPKPIIPNEEEIYKNPRSRSAKLRIFEKK
ncbi:MAG: 16S rRNA (cytosine(1402)-N(4))-methyltransferase RsmH [Patescibacteria group bacterium]|jgi:16S rRNA (cytosine1402-N4)-methyltransferase